MNISNRVSHLTRALVERILLLGIQLVSPFWKKDISSLLPAFTASSIQSVTRTNARFDQDMNTQMHELLDYGKQHSGVFLYLLELTCPPTAYFFANSALCIFHGMWLSVALEYSSAFHQLLSNTAYRLQTDNQAQCQFKLEDSSHQISAVHLLKKRLDILPREEPINLIRSIVAPAVRANINEDYTVWEMHLEAIRKIVTLGNLKSVENIPECFRCILFWVDVNGSLGRDAFPFFPVPKYLPLSTLRVTENVREELHSTLFFIQERLSSLGKDKSFVQTLQQIKRLTIYIDLHPDIWPGSSEVGFIVMRLLHELLSLRSDTLDVSDHCGSLREVIRIAALLSLAPIRRLLLGFRISSGVLVGKLRVLLSMLSGRYSDDIDYSQLRLWIAMVALAEATNSVDVAFFAEEAQFVEGSLGISAWEDVETALMEGVMWCRSVHSLIVRPIWEVFCSKQRIELGSI